jgi:hypothetical protein
VAVSVDVGVIVGVSVSVPVGVSETVSVGVSFTERVSVAEASTVEDGAGVSVALGVFVGVAASKVGVSVCMLRDSVGEGVGSSWAATGLVSKSNGPAKNSKTASHNRTLRKNVADLLTFNVTNPRLS